MKNYDDSWPQRKRPAHLPPLEIGNRTTLIFLTVCTKNRKPILARPDTADLLIATWSQATHWLVGNYVILPDHIHLFCAPGRIPPSPLTTWVNFWKASVTRSWPYPEEKPLWQKEYWDRQLRQGDSYSAKWDYVRSNPVRHNLVNNAADWPYQGELHPLDWHDA